VLRTNQTTTDALLALARSPLMPRLPRLIVLTARHGGQHSPAMLRELGRVVEV